MLMKKPGATQSYRFFGLRPGYIKVRKAGQADFAVVGACIFMILMLLQDLVE